MKSCEMLGNYAVCVVTMYYGALNQGC
jgi:hypothetical protein